MDAAIAGLLGTAIGAGASLITIWIQARYQSKRERSRTILEFAMRDRQMGLEHSDKVLGPSVILPLAVHAHFQEGLLKLIEDGKLSETTLAKLHRENDQLIDSIKEEKVQRVVTKAAEKIAQRQQGG